MNTSNYIRKFHYIDAPMAKIATDCERPTKELRPEPINGETIPEPKIREINIQAMDHGFVVRVGCQTFAIEDAQKLMNNLTAYLKDPGGMEKQWMGSKKLN